MKAQAAKGKRTRRKAGAAASSEEDTEGEHTQDEVVEARPRPKPRRVTRGNPVVVEEDADNLSHDEANIVTPRAQRTANLAKVPRATPEEHEDSPMQSLTPSEPHELHDTTTPKALKRPRDEDETEDPTALNGTEEAEPEPVEIPDIQVRRKRIRH